MVLRAIMIKIIIRKQIIFEIYKANINNSAYIHINSKFYKFSYTHEFDIIFGLFFIIEIIRIHSAYNYGKAKNSHFNKIKLL